MHQTPFDGDRLTSAPEFPSVIEEYFKINGFDVSHAFYFSTNTPGKLNFIFELSTLVSKLTVAI
ncbi:hypothetical protein ACSGAP_003159 [Salmonella bongori]|uniref:Uncharacterized protein n=1 Tax=Salmonella enterica TaxID=28901 RepID=A0A750KM89_SALER|nr:hypothetical protein [Salmonella bongori]MBA2137971.1 hypothetical protein [Salmonella bongori serovar 66:z39:-]